MLRPLVPWLSTTCDCWLLLQTKKTKTNHTRAREERCDPKTPTSQKLSPVHLSWDHLTEKPLTALTILRAIDEILSFQQLRSLTDKQNSQTHGTKLCQNLLYVQNRNINGKPRERLSSKCLSKTVSSKRESLLPNSQKKTFLLFTHLPKSPALSSVSRESLATFQNWSPNFKLQSKTKNSHADMSWNGCGMHEMSHQV